MRVFAVTYTYNDTPLADALLGDMLRWSIRPSTVLVVDDGSTPAYALPPKGAAAAPDLDLRLLRLEPNQGPALAKRAGLDAAAASGADVILSLDADIRPHPAWLAAALPYLADPALGLVGAEIAHGLGGDSLSRYLRALFTPSPEDKAVPFLKAGLWLLRRNVWQDTRGFDDFMRPTHEDLYFCRKLAALGLRMQAVNSRPVSQVRRLHRQAYMRREIAYLGFAIHKMAHKEGLESALLPLAQQAAARLRHIVRHGEAEFLYLEIFKHAALLAWLHTHSAATPPNAHMAKGLLTACLQGLAPYPNTLALLCQDLAAIDLPVSPLPVSPQPGGQAPQDTPSPLPGPEHLAPLLLKLEIYGVRKLNAEQSSVAFDPHYLTPASFAVDKYIC